MTNIKKYNEVFIESFGVKAEDLNDKLAYQSITEWDSVGHMNMIAKLEDVFKISMEMDDIIDFSSYKVGIKMLKKYKIKI